MEQQARIAEPGPLLWVPPTTSALALLGSPPCPGPAHLQGQLVSKERTDEVAGVSANPAQEEPQGQGLVHVARLARLDVLPAAEEETCAQALRAVASPRRDNKGTAPR